MITVANIPQKTSDDLTAEMVLLNVPYTPLTSLLYARKRVSPTDSWFVKEKVKSLSTVKSGGRKADEVAPASETSSFTYVENNTEIFSKRVSITGEAAKILGGTEAALDKEQYDRLTEVKGDIEAQFITGVKRDENETVGKTMNGLLNQVTHPGHIIDKLAAAITKADIDAAMQKLFISQALGERFALINSGDVEKVSALYVNATNATINLVPENTAVGISVKKIITNFGEVNLVISTIIPAGTLLFFVDGYVEIKEFRAPFYKRLGVTGDQDGGMVVAQNTIIAAPIGLVKVVNFI